MINKLLSWITNHCMFSVQPVSQLHEYESCLNILTTEDSMRSSKNHCFVLLHKLICKAAHLYTSHLEAQNIPKLFYFVFKQKQAKSIDWMFSRLSPLAQNVMFFKSNWLKVWFSRLNYCSCPSFQRSVDSYWYQSTEPFLRNSNG